MTGITEAAKSRTPLVVLAAETGGRRAAVELPHRPGRPGRRGRRGAERVHGPGPRRRRRRGRWPSARSERRTGGAEPAAGRPGRSRCRSRPDRRSGRVARAAAGRRRGRGRWPTLLAAARSGRCSSPAAAPSPARAGGPERWPSSAARCWPPRRWPTDCSPATRGRWASPAGSPRPLAAELIGAADVVVAWGCALNMWTTRHGALIGAGATVVQVDLDPDAIGAHHRVDLGVVGDVAATAPRGRCARRAPARAPPATGYGDAAAGRPHRATGRGADVPYRRRRRRGPTSIRARCRHRARRPAAGRADRRGRLRQLHGLPGMYLSRAGRARASASPRRSSRSGWGWPPRSAPRWRGRTGCPWPRSATAGS